MVSSPNLVVPLKNSTLVSVAPDAALAVAVRLMPDTPVKILPLVGCVKLTEGGIGALTVIIRDADMVEVPLLA